MRCRQCDTEAPEGGLVCQKCGASLRGHTLTAFRGVGEPAGLDPALDATIKPALAARLKEWSVSAKDALFALHLVGRNYPLGRLTHLRVLLEEGLIRPETPVLHQKRGRWYEAHRFPGIAPDGQFFPENTQQLREDKGDSEAEELSASTTEGRAVLAARLGREAEEAAAKGDIYRAIEIYEEVVEINPRYPLVKRRLRELRAECASSADDLAARKVSLPASADVANQYDERTTALSTDDLVELTPPPPGGSAAKRRSSSHPRSLGLTPEALRRQSMGQGASLRSPQPVALPPAFAIDPDEPSVSTVQEAVLEPTAVLDVEESTAQELVFEDTPVEHKISHMPPQSKEKPRRLASGQLASLQPLNSIELNIQHTLDVILSSANIPSIPSQIVEQLSFSQDVRDVDWGDVALLFSKAGVRTPGAAMLKRAFCASQSVCLLYLEMELIGVARAISDGVAVATICDLVISPHVPLSLIATALVGAILQELDVPTIVLLAGPSHIDAMSALGFAPRGSVLMREEMA